MAQTVELSSSGQLIRASSFEVQGRTLVVTGSRLRRIAVHDEVWLPGPLINDVPEFVKSIRAERTGADIFTFAQTFTNPLPRHPYSYEWDNIAAIPLSTSEEWWEKQVSHDLRKDVKRSEKRGVVVSPAVFDEKFALGIKAIYDETPFRQGRRFWHYKKPLDAVIRENSSYMERSQFIGAFLGDELIGFVKIVFVDEVARMMQILALDKHQDKRTMNALIAKAVEIACIRGSTYLTYGAYTYDGRRSSSVALFKRRNGFKEIFFPRYYIPLTWKGAVVMRTRLHLGIKRLIPEKIYEGLRRLRARTVYHDSSNEKDVVGLSVKTQDDPICADQRRS